MSSSFIGKPQSLGGPVQHTIVFLPLISDFLSLPHQYISLSLSILQQHFMGPAWKEETTQEVLARLIMISEGQAVKGRHQTKPVKWYTRPNKLARPGVATVTASMSASDICPWMTTNTIWSTSDFGLYFSFISFWIRCNNSDVMELYQYKE